MFQYLMTMLDTMMPAFARNWEFPMRALPALASLVLIGLVAVFWQKKVTRDAFAFVLDKAGKYLRRKRTGLDATLHTTQIEQQHATQDALQAVRDAANELYCSIHGISYESSQCVSTSFQALWLPMPELKLKDPSNWPFATELVAIARALFKLETLVDAGCVELVEIEFVSDWVNDLKRRWQKHVSEENWEYRSIERCLDILRMVHTAAYSPNLPAYHSFRGALHMLEALVEERIIPVETLWRYVDSLDRQLWNIRSALPKEATQKVVMQTAVQTPVSTAL